MKEEEEKENMAEKEKEVKPKDDSPMEENNEGNIEFLRYLQEVEKHPFEVEALKTSIESNKSSVRLAKESISHFESTRTDNKRTLRATLGVSILTVIILIVQTLSTNKMILEKPIELESKQVQELIKAQENNNLILIKAQERNNHILSSLIDSLNAELQKLTKTISRNKKNKSK